MKKNFTLIICVAIILAVASCTENSNSPADIKYPDTGRGSIVSVDKVENLTKSFIDDELSYISGTLGLPTKPKSRNGVTLYRVIYNTVDESGSSTQASGFILFPTETSQSYPLISYQHGAIVKREDVAFYDGYSRDNFETFISLYYASQGYIVCSADYLGLGYSQGLHNLLHAESLASSVVDMIFATKNIIAAENKYLHNGQLFLAGYSEGGFATMATHREIEKNYQYLQIIASAPMAGPYDLDGTMERFILSDKYYSYTYFLPYTLLSYSRLYSDVPPLDAMFLAKYASILPDLFDGTKNGLEINDYLPNYTFDMLKPEFIDDFKENDDNPLKEALGKNDLTHWTPHAPMRLYHCLGDELVGIENSQIAEKNFKATGAKEVKLIDLGDKGHEGCAPYAILGSLLWFDSLRED